MRWKLGGTFGIEEGAVRVLMAGGLPTNVQMTGDTEDETDSLSIALADIGARDTLVAVSASGSTPYTLEAARIAKQRGARIVAIAHNPDAPLLALGDCSHFVANSTGGHFRVDPHGRPQQPRRLP